MREQVVDLTARIRARQDERGTVERRVQSATHTLAVKLARAYPDARLVPDSLRDACRDWRSVDARPIASKLTRELVTALDSGCDARRVADAIRGLADDVEACGLAGRAA